MSLGTDSHVRCILNICMYLCAVYRPSNRMVENKAKTGQCSSSWANHNELCAGNKMKKLQIINAEYVFCGIITTSFTCNVHIAIILKANSALAISISVSTCLRISFYMNVMRLELHSYFLFGCHFAISFDCDYYYYCYLSLLWYCNRFHCQGRIAEQSPHMHALFVRRVYYYYSDCSLDALRIDDNCILFIQFIRYKYEINLNWHRLTMRFCFHIVVNFLLFRSMH